MSDAKREELQQHWLPLRGIECWSCWVKSVRRHENQLAGGNIMRALREPGETAAA